MRILMLSWRDMKNPLKGGAEIVTDAYLKGLAERNHDVVLFSSAFDGAAEEEYNGYKILRKGGKLGVYWHGLIYAKKNENSFDVIIDQVNTIPFFTPLLIKKEKRIAFFHQLCLDVWFYETMLPVAAIGFVSELIYLKLYRNTKCIAVSESTKRDLINHTWNEESNILVLENQIDFKPVKKPGKKEKSFVFCGRLKKSKRVEDCINALALLGNNETKLYIIGDGDESYKLSLKRLASELKLDGRVIFTGQIDLKERNKIMSKCIALLGTSVREGWGLIVTEANANGTVAITYDVPGLRDSNKTGFLCEKNEPEIVVKYMELLLNDENLMLEKSKEGVMSIVEHNNLDDNVEVFERWANNYQ